MTWIYFCLIDGSKVKIGKADNLKKRLGQHSKGTLDVHEVSLLAAVSGSPADERHVQRYFTDDACDDLRPNNGNTPELFLPTPRLTNYVRWLRNQWFVRVDMEDIPEETVTSEFWHPNEERQTPPPKDPLFPPDWLEFTERVITGDDYYTPPDVLECVRKVLGSIDLDPASHALANRHVKATRFYSAQDDGLKQKWAGRVWLNPPYSQWKHWVPKVVSEWNRGRVQSMCVVCATRTLTAQYFRPLLDWAEAACIITGRKKFNGLGKDPDDGHMIFYAGPEVDKFHDVFGAIGSTWNAKR